MMIIIIIIIIIIITLNLVINDYVIRCEVPYLTN